MLTKIISSALVGLDGKEINIEADVSPGFPQFILVGLPDKAVEESRQRIPTAVRNAGFEFPGTKRIVVNLAPAGLKKEGAAFDLPIALGILAANNLLQSPPEKSVFVGELALDGSVRPVRGILPLAIWAKEAGRNEIFVPLDNAQEAAVVSGLKVVGVGHLRQVVEHLNGLNILPYTKRIPQAEAVVLEGGMDMAHISGQEHAKRALEIAAAGGHNVLMSGPPGSGKTLLARALVSILPEMSFAEQLEVTKLYSIAGKLSPGTPLVRERPFRSPHHTASGVALVGGGANPRPGEISLAHRGVLFLDEFGEFSRHVLENLRQPLEDGVITVSRAQGSLSFPARFMLTAAQNPCPCGYYGDTEKECVCTPGAIAKYKHKISGPIIDRIDLHINVPRLPFEKLARLEAGEASVDIRGRVNRARQKQIARLRELRVLTNSEMPPQVVKDICILESSARELIRQAVESMHLSGRAYHRILKVARTIADLSDESGEIKSAHIAEALQYRPGLE